MQKAIVTIFTPDRAKVKVFCCDEEITYMYASLEESAKAILRAQKQKIDQLKLYDLIARLAAVKLAQQIKWNDWRLTTMVSGRVEEGYYVHMNGS